MYLFPNIYEILVLMSTTPVTSCECKRSFSRLRTIKTNLRSTMIKDRLNGLSLLYIRVGGFFGFL